MAPTEDHPFEYRDGAGELVFRMFVDENGILNNVMRGTLTPAAGRALLEQLLQHHERVDRRYVHLIDSAAVTDVAPEARKLLADALLRRDSVVFKLAFVGPGLVMRKLLNLYGRISHVPLKGFASKEEAVCWLQEGGER